MEKDYMYKDICCNMVYINLQKEKPNSTTIKEKYTHIRNQYPATRENLGRLCDNMEDV